MNSKITLSLDGEGLITKHVEEWDHKGNPDGDDGFVGKLMEGRKKFDAKVIEKTMPSDPSKV